MSLPRKVRYFVFSFILISFVFINFGALAFATHDTTPVENPTNGVRGETQNPEITPLPAPSSSEIQPIPVPERDYKINQAQWWNPADWVGSVVGFVTGAIADAVRKAWAAFLDFNFELITGFSYGTLGLFSEKMEFYNQYSNGEVSFNQIPHPGLLDFTALVVTEQVQMNIPINSNQYFASINPFTEARAQSGVQDLANNSVILEVWQRVRNVAYALSAVVLVILGFLIMFRWKIDPRTSVTIQNSLPRIVVSLLLITFSFAISGLMIDLTRLVTSVVMALVDVPGASIVAFVVSMGTLTLILGIFSFFGSTIALFGLLLGLLLAIIVLVVFIVLIYKLLTRYVIFLLMTIFAPFFFLVGALPGGEGMVLNWFKRQAAALLAIPITVLFVNLSVKIGFSNFEFNSPTNISGGFPSPWPVIGPLNFALGITLLPPLIGLGIFFFSTKVPDIVDELFGIKELGARKGIGPGAILGAPLAAAGTIGNVGRAMPYVRDIRENASNAALGGLSRLPGVGGRFQRMAVDRAGASREKSIKREMDQFKLRREAAEKYRAQRDEAAARDRANVPPVSEAVDGEVPQTYIPEVEGGRDETPGGRR